MKGAVFLSKKGVMSTEFVKNGTKSGAASPIHRWLRWLDNMILAGWRVFISLKFGITLLVIIGIASIYGTLRYASNAAFGDNAIPMARALYFESTWFVALLVLFAINLIFSTWHVSKMSVTIWSKKDFRRGRAYYQYGKTPRAELEAPGGVDAAVQKLRKHFTQVRCDGDAIFAHKGLLSRVGPTIVHIGILTVIFSQVAKAFLLWNGMVVTEGRFLGTEGGATINYINEPIALEQQITETNRVERPMDHWIRVLDFDEIKHPNSEMPAYFSSLVEVYDPATQEKTVAQLDMNHSLKVGDLQFHQAGFVPTGEQMPPRINMDVRDATTGERIAVTDVDANNRVRVGDSDLFLETTGVEPADRWRLFHLSNPNKIIAEGLLTGGKQLNFAFRVDEMYPHFRINPDSSQPENASDDPVNPALKVSLLLDGRKVAETWLFLEESLAEMLPDIHPRFRLNFEDIRARTGESIEEIDWKNPEDVIYAVSLFDRDLKERAGVELIGFGETSRAYPYESHVSHGDQLALGTENGYEVKILGPAERYTTILSVVKEPTVFWTKVGVGILLIGSIMTFAVRYRSFYGWWDPKTETLRVALVPRWGQTPVQEEFDRLVNLLSDGRGPIQRDQTKEPDGETLDEDRPAHESLNPDLAKV